MAGLRLERVAETVKRVVSQMIREELEDPGVGMITVTRVRVSADLQNATVYFMALGRRKDRARIEASLGRAAGFLRRRLAQHMTTRRVPALRFRWDEEFERAERVGRVLEEIRRTP